MKTKDFEKKIIMLRDGKSIEAELKGDKVTITLQSGKYTVSSDMFEKQEFNSKEDLIKDFKDVGLIEKKLDEAKTYKDINEKIFYGKGKIGKKIVTIPVSAKDEKEATTKFITRIELEQKNGHVPKGDITDIIFEDKTLDEVEAKIYKSKESYTFDFGANGFIEIYDNKEVIAYPKKKAENGLMFKDLKELNTYISKYFNYAIDDKTYKELQNKILNEKEEYKEYFQKKLDKYGVEDPSELDADKKKEFFDEVDAGWKGEDEKPEANENIIESLETSILNFVATKDVDAFKSGLKDEFMTALGENEDFKIIQSDMMKFKG